MANIRLSRTVLKKDQFDKSIDTSFKSFVDTVEVDNDTIEEFFRLYNKLYYDIEPEGEFNSHEFLIKESSKLVDFERNDEAIQPLLDEISDLRKRLLEQNADAIETENDILKSIGNSENIDLEGGLKGLQDRINRSSEQIDLDNKPTIKPVLREEPASDIVKDFSTKRKRRFHEVAAEGIRLKRLGKTRLEIKQALTEFGASKAHIARVI
jgi:hypothetical protein